MFARTSVTTSTVSFLLASTHINHIISADALHRLSTGKGGSWAVNVERTPASRRDSECAGYNRCSHGRACGPPPGGWTVNPEVGMCYFLRSFIL